MVVAMQGRCRPIPWWLVGLLVVLAGCRAGPETQAEAAKEAATVLTPELQAALDEGMAKAAEEQAGAEKAAAVAEKKLKVVVAAEKASESPRNDGIHDPLNEALAVLQDPTQAMADFPRDRRGEVDWVASLAEGLINPRADLQGETEMEILDMDILMKGTQFMPWVLFPHERHTRWLDCSNCHDEIFKPEMGANDIDMNAVLAGEFCGVCHGKVSFSLFICERCHSVPHPGSGEKWW